MSVNFEMSFWCLHFLQKRTKTSQQVVNSSLFVHLWKKRWLEKIISKMSELYCSRGVMGLLFLVWGDANGKFTFSNSSINKVAIVKNAFLLMSL